MKFLIFLIPLLCCNMGWSKPLGGMIALWQRPSCNPRATCAAPTQIGQPVSVNLNIELPTDASTNSSDKREISIEGWTISLEIYSVIKPNQIDLLVTQIFLIDPKGNLISQCTHYDSFTASNHLPVGACSGTLEKNQYGVSVFKAN